MAYSSSNEPSFVNEAVRVSSFAAAFLEDMVERRLGSKELIMIQINAIPLSL
jgi:hypothetical protein